MKDITFCVGGPAGQGIKTVGFNFGKVMLRHGYYVHDNDEYPSLIKGGHNVLWARAADEKIYSHNSKIHLLLALDKNTVCRYQDQMEPGGVIIVDEKQVKLKDEDKTRDDLHYISLPLYQTALEVAENAIMFNTVGLAAVFSMLGVDIEVYKEVLEEQFQHKGERVVEGNKKAAQAGYDLGKVLKPHENWDFPVRERSEDQAYFLTGNQAICYGAVNAGCKLLCSYPMTPASSVMEFFGALEHSHQLVLKHVEDEVAALNMTIGAWHAGTRAMVATSGGGFVLMAEALGFAAVSEAGPVIFVGMRPGPGTGVPTFTGQADLRFVMHAGQDEFPRIILTPGDPEECFYVMQEAFNWSDRYQTPVFVLSDKFLAESHFTTPRLDDQRVPVEKGKVTFDTLPEDYVRYATAPPDGVSLRAIPGTPGGSFLANSYEHDEYGFATEEAEMILKQRQKRQRKLEAIMQEMPMPSLLGPAEALLTLITWGSTKMVAREAMRMLDADGIVVNVLHFSHVFPLDWKGLKSELRKYPKTLLVEGNGEGQFQGLLKQYCDFLPTDFYRRIDGRPFYPEEIVKKVKEMMV